MTTAPVLAPSNTDTNDPTTHVICCNWNVALCGLDVSGQPVVPDGVGHDCIVCLDLEEQRCPHCGTEPAETAR